MRRTLALIPLVAGCDQPWLDMEPDRVCDDVGFAIAARTFECLDDEELAQDRFDAFERAYACRVRSLDEPIDRYYHCPVEVNAIDCPSVRKFGGDLDLWLQRSSVCAVILEYADGTRLPFGEEP